MMLIQHSVNSDRLVDTQSRVPQADWLILENNEKATLNINMPFYIILACHPAKSDSRLIWIELDIAWQGRQAIPILSFVALCDDMIM